MKNDKALEEAWRFAEWLKSVERPVSQQAALEMRWIKARLEGLIHESERDANT